MFDNGQGSRFDSQANGQGDAATTSLMWRSRSISQAETFRDLTLAIAASLTVAMLANLLALCS